MDIAFKTLNTAMGLFGNTRNMKLHQTKLAEQYTHGSSKHVPVSVLQIWHAWARPRSHAKSCRSFTILSLKWSIPFTFSDKNIVFTSYFPQATKPAHLILPIISIWRSIKIANLFITHFSPASCYFFHLSCTKSPQCSVRRYLQSTVA